MLHLTPWRCQCNSCVIMHEPISSVLDTPKFFWSVPDHLQVRLLCLGGCKHEFVQCLSCVYVHGACYG
jgi:hypothetical protein